MAVIGVTASIAIEVGSSYQEIAEVKQFNFPAVAVTSIETTHLGITDYYKTFTSGMRDGGEVSFTCAYSATTCNLLDGKIGDDYSWQVIGPDDSVVTITFDAFITKLETSMEPDAEAMITCTLKVTGKPTVA